MNISRWHARWPYRIRRPESSVSAMLQSPDAAHQTTTHRTALLKEAGLAGLARENGLSMLVHQAAKALEIWTSEQVCADSMFACAREVMQKR